jgi:hypothetical protein
MPLFKKQDKPRFFGGLLGAVSRKLAPLAGTALGGYLSSLSANPYAMVAGATAGNYLGNKGGEYVGQAFEDYTPFKKGGQIPRKKFQSS